MDSTTLIASLLADVPDRFAYFNLYKIPVVVVLLFGWASTVGWIDKDTDVVKTKREQWNTIVAAGAVVAFFVLLVPPWRGPLFFVGVGFFLLIAGGAIGAYIIHRNGRTVPASRVLTPAYFKRLIGGDGKTRKAKKDKGIRVHLADAAGNTVEAPEEAEEYSDYLATQDFLFDALWRRASDVEVLAGKEQYRVVYRIDGVPLERQDTLAPENGERLFRFLKRLAGLNVEEIRKPQSGHIHTSLLGQSGEAGRTEVHTSGTTAGERLRLHVDTGASLIKLEELGFATARCEMVREMIAKPTGLVLLSAPSGHGLTTTQYAMLRDHDAYTRNIHTIERQRMLDLDNITQQVHGGDNAEVVYSRMLQTVLRREPDIVLASRCEDRETAQVATRAAAEDRKIYMGIKAADCFEAISKYLSFVEDNQMAANALLGVVNQRLMRVLCTECREAFKPDPVTLKKLNLPVDKIECFYRPPSEPLRDKKGNEIICQRCQGSGYVGRIGVFEVLMVDSAVSKLIADGTAIKRIKSQCRKNKMAYLQEEALLKVIDGTTSMNEVLRALRNTGK